jgi:hypothetical protein
MEDWKLGDKYLKENNKKGKSFYTFKAMKIKRYEEFKSYKNDTVLFFRYYTFLHKAMIHEGFGTDGLLAMFTNFNKPFYSQKTLDEMLQPIVTHMVGLRARLCDAYPENQVYTAIVQQAMDELIKNRADRVLVHEGKNKGLVKSKNK